MNNIFQENKQAFLLLLGLLFILIGVFYFLFYQPLTKERDSAVEQEVTLQDEIESLNSEINQQDSIEIDNNEFENMILAKKMPDNPELEEFLLTLNEIELVSDSRIENLAFSYDGSLPERLTEEEDEETADTDENSTVGNPGEELVSEEEELIEEAAVEVNSIMEMEGKPENLRLITVRIEVFSPDYDQFQTFLTEIENQERIMMVNRLEFEKPAEQELVIENSEDETIRTVVDVTTFYYDYSETGS